MPEMEFDVITLGHGSGGLLTNKLLDAGVFSLIENDFLKPRHDGALLNLSGEVAYSTDSFVVSPIFFPGGNIGELSVNGTVNDLAMCGAVPKYISLGMILEEGLRMDELWEVLLGIRETAVQAGVQIVTGDTKVVEKGKGDKIFINTTGIGQVLPGSVISIDEVKVGDKIIISNNIATHGIAIMSVRAGLEFETDIESDTTSLHRCANGLVERFGHKIHLLRDPTRGGIGTVLNEISKQVKVGMDIRETELPVDPQVAGACELLGLDPLHVANEGVFVAIVDGSISEQAVEFMSSFSESKNAVAIGEVVNDHPEQVVLESRIHGKRIVSMLIGEQLPRIC
jgi:hydrogenase expression/formation protein HypE